MLERLSRLIRRPNAEDPPFEEAVLREAFDSQYYLATNPDVAEASVDPLDHYLRYGWREGRKPCDEFDTEYYLRFNEDVRRSGVNPFYHYLVQGKREGRLPKAPLEQMDIPPELAWVADLVKEHFDGDHYLNMNPDVHQAGVDPLVHYITIGWKEGRDPSPEFDVSYYLATNSDVASAGVEPFAHYLAEGIKEGRCPKPSATHSLVPSDQWRSAINPFFDEAFYLTNNPDVAANGVVEPLDHYLETGWLEGRDPSSEFSTRFYLQANPDVASAGMNPLLHYAIAGKREGRLCRHPGGYKADVLRSLEDVEHRLENWIVPQAPKIASAHVLVDKISQLEATMPVVVSLSHDKYCENVGGVQVCIQEEQWLFCRRGYSYIHLSPSQPLPTFSALPSTEWCASVVLDGTTVGDFEGEDVLDVLGNMALGRRVIMVVHALHGHQPEWVQMLHERIEPESAWFWIHDYFSMCIGYNLLRNDVTYCGAPPADSAACQLCVYGEKRKLHLRWMQQIFTAINFNVVAPSDFTRQLWLDKSGLPYSRIMVAEHRKVEFTRRESRSSNAPVRVAFLGHSAYHKGWHAFRRLVQRCCKDARYEFYHLGMTPDTSLKVRFQHVQFSEDEPAAMQSAVRQNQIDVVLLLSETPETFCLTAHEAVAGGALLIAKGTSGNAAAMARRGNNGFVIVDDEELVSIFESGAVAAMAKDHRAKGVNTGRLVSSGMTSGVLAMLDVGADEL